MFSIELIFNCLTLLLIVAPVLPFNKIADHPCLKCPVNRPNLMSVSTSKVLCCILTFNLHQPTTCSIWSNTTGGIPVELPTSAWPKILSQLPLCHNQLCCLWQLKSIKYSFYTGLCTTFPSVLAVQEDSSLSDLVCLPPSVHCSGSQLRKGIPKNGKDLRHFPLRAERISPAIKLLLTKNRRSSEHLRKLERKKTVWSQ